MPVPELPRSIRSSILLKASAEVDTFPIEVENLRTAFFADFGRAYKDYDSFEFGELKGSVGLSVKWLSPFGGISVSISTPLNSEAGDKTESFQFNLGTN